MSRIFLRGKVWYYERGGQTPKSLKVENPVIAKQMKFRLDERAEYADNGLSDPHLSWAEYREQYETGYDVNAENTIVKLNYVLNSFERLVKPTTVRGVSVADCERWRALRLKEVAPVTLDGEQKYLRPFFKRAAELKCIQIDPFALMRKFKFAKRKAKRVTFEEAQRFLEHLEPQYYMLGVLLYDLGLRREEAAAQRIQDVDLVHGVLHVKNHEESCECLRCKMKRRKERRSVRPGLFNTKNLSERSLPLTERLQKLLFEFYQGQKTDCIFKVHELTITEICKRAFKAAKVEGKVAAHTLRHCFADDMRRAGVDEDTRKALVGHGKTDVHEDYMHVDQEEMVAAIKRLWVWREEQRVKLQETVIDGVKIISAAG